MGALSSRTLLHPADSARSRRFYRDVLGLAIYRDFGPPDIPGWRSSRPAFPEVSGHTARPWRAPGHNLDPGTGYPCRATRLAAAAVRVIREPATEPRGLIGMRIEDPDGIRIALAEVPAGHPLRRDPRSPSPPR